MSEGYLPENEDSIAQVADESIYGKGWSSSKAVSGIRDVKCDNWGGFVNFITDSLSDYRSYIFRGHSSKDWVLKPTLERLISETGHKYRVERDKHLNNFKMATRGRRGFIDNLSDKEWWALGQHNGLATPLLDWTESPYVAAYFALSGRPSETTDYCIVYGISTNFITITMNKGWDKKTFAGGLEVFRPRSNDNPRLVGQRGLFTISDSNTPINDWIQEHAEAQGFTKGALLRIFIPTQARDHALRNLNLMNVNHLSLFPDLYGASKYCNFQLTVEKY